MDTHNPFPPDDDISASQDTSEAASDVQLPSQVLRLVGLAKLMLANDLSQIDDFCQLVCDLWDMRYIYKKS
jgi:hypothetical protein